jgi:branched-chain amino acid transport system permease protein
MNLQFLVDGLLVGATIGLGAIGVSLTYSILGFANFAHGEFIAWGAYAALAIVGAIGFAVAPTVAPLGPFSFGWPLLVGGAAAMVLTGGLALLLDAILFGRLRRRGNAIVMVMASFGAAIALRSLLEFIFTAQPVYFSRAIQIAIPLGGGMKATPDQLLVLALALILAVTMLVTMNRTTLGRSMKAVAENPSLAAVVGVDVRQVVRATWLLGGALAATAGIMVGVTVQIRPYMGFDLLLPLFAAAILGGIGSMPGAVFGGLIVGVAEAASVPLVGAGYRGAVAFVVLIGVLLVRPTGIFGRRE